MKNWFLLKRWSLLRGNKLVVFYHLSVSEIRPYKRGGVWWIWPYMRGWLYFISNLYIFSLILTEWYCQYQQTHSATENIGQCNGKHIMTLSIKTITSLLKAFTYIMTGITGHPIRLTAILAIMSVSTFTTANILYIH